MTDAILMRLRADVSLRARYGSHPLTRPVIVGDYQVRIRSRYNTICGLNQIGEVGVTSIFLGIDGHHDGVLNHPLDVKGIDRKCNAIPL